MTRARLDDLPLTPLDVAALKQSAARPVGNGKLGHGVAARARRKLRVLERDGFRCKRCGSTKNLTIDHVGWTPGFNKSGPSSIVPELCQTLCVWCHHERNKQQSQLRRSL